MQLVSLKTLLFLLILSFYHCICDTSSRRRITIPLGNGSKHTAPILYRFIIGNEETPDFLPCNHCFGVHTTHNRDMLVVPCGGSDCVSILYNNQSSEKNERIHNYDFENCGIVVPKNSSIINTKLKLKISTGIEDTLAVDEYPWLVRLRTRPDILSGLSRLCAGTLIHPQWILTAAHCLFNELRNGLYNPEDIILHMGHYDRSTTSHKTYIKTPILYLIHPKFEMNRMSAAMIHDLALLKLAKPVLLSSSIGTACLPEETDQLKANTLAFVAGWGATPALPRFPDQPRKARIKIAPQSCQKLHTDGYLHICGRSERGRNICEGDSGSGLMVRAGIKLNETTTVWKWHLFAVASYGPGNCSEHENHNNVFASVPADIKWIHDVIRKY